MIGKIKQKLLLYYKAHSSISVQLWLQPTYCGIIIHSQIHLKISFLSLSHLPPSHKTKQKTNKKKPTNKSSPIVGAIVGHFSAAVVLGVVIPTAGAIVSHISGVEVADSRKLGFRFGISASRWVICWVIWLLLLQ